MRRIEMFETEDRKLFHKQSEAEAHEKMYNEVAEIVTLLGGWNNDIDRSCDFVNGEGYYTLDPEDLLKANTKMRALVNSVFDSKPAFASRIVYEHELLGIASRIYSCIHENKRYGQAYYALNPTKCKNKEFNKKRLKDGNKCKNACHS